MQELAAQRKLVWLSRSDAGMGAQTRLEGSVELASDAKTSRSHFAKLPVAFFPLLRASLCLDAAGHGGPEIN